MHRFGDVGMIPFFILHESHLVGGRRPVTDNYIEVNECSLCENERRAKQECRQEQNFFHKELFSEKLFNL
jgi:hypothetical protein